MTFVNITVFETLAKSLLEISSLGVSASHLQLEIGTLFHGLLISQVLPLTYVSPVYDT